MKAIGCILKKTQIKLSFKVISKYTFNNLISSSFSSKFSLGNKLKINDIPNLNEFINQSNFKTELITEKNENENDNIQDDLIPVTTKDYEESCQEITSNSSSSILNGKKYYLETFGCQMNINDSEIIKSILNKSGLVESEDKESTDIIFFNTCSVRESAEEKVIEKIKHCRILKENNKNLILGILGCMAERKKESLLELNETLKKQYSKISIIDLVAGPDSYKDLPRMLSALIKKESKFEINTQLSIEETYGDIIPVRVKNSIKAFVSIMRGCNNMCSFCIVPFTRGKERSRDLISIYNEIKELSNQGVKEITLLGQNVNSYFVSNSNDLSIYSDYLNNISNRSKLKKEILKEIHSDIQLTPKVLSDGFSQMQKISKENDISGIRFTNLLFFLAENFPDIQFRFTSPHPKDFPDQLIRVIKYKHNICKSIHMPLQAGNSEVLASMKRFYTKESYINLVKKIRELIPDVKISSDFIVGFCGETENQFKDTLDVCEKVQFDTAYMFIYSMRPKTHAYYKLKDNVSKEEKV
jgi:tRNA A37 methylthiotransferase MiaB